MADNFFPAGTGSPGAGATVLLRGFLCASALAALALAACGGAKSNEFQVLRAEIFTIKQEQRQLHDRVAELDSLVQSRVRILDEFNAGFQADARELRERLAVIEQRLDDTEKLVSRLQSSGPPSAGPAAPGSVKTAEGQGAAQRPEEAFELARKDYLASNYQIAIEGFRDFIARFPESAQVPEAYFYIGNCYLSLKNLDQAIASFGNIVQQYPSSDLHPDALYKIGICHIQRGDKQRGEFFLDAVIQKFPDSNAANLAREALKR